MSLEYSRAVWKISFENAGLKLIALALADFANDLGECWPSHESLSRMCGMNQRHLRRNLGKLRDIGILSWRPRFEANKQKSNIYTLHVIDGGRACAPSPGGPARPTEPPIDPPLSKESKETGACSASPAFSPEWKPDPRSKEQKLAALPVQQDYPTEQDFDAFLEAEDLLNVIEYRPDLYQTLCRNKWHKWNERLGKWVKIRDWKAFTRALDETITNANT